MCGQLQEFFEEGQESLSTLLLKKTQESYDLQDALKTARANYFQRIKKCEEKEKELELKVINALLCVVSSPQMC